MKSLANSLAKLMPPKLAARIDHLTHHRKFFYPYNGGAMNGQTARAEIVRGLLEYCGIERIIETGTYRGTTTEWFGRFGLPVLSAEAVERYAEFSRLRVRNLPNVQIHRKNSVDLLKEIVAAKDGLEKPTLFYLDAHWYDYLPLRDEYEIICEHFSHPIMVVDDFQVPDDPDYGFDDYGPGKALTLDYFTANGAAMPAHIFFPVTKARWETGARRGCVVLTNDDALAETIERRVPLLRRWRSA